MDLMDALQHLPPMFAVRHRLRIDDCDVCTSLAIVAVQLCSHCHVEWLAEILLANRSFKLLAARLTFLCCGCFQRLDLLGRHAQNLDCSFVKCSEPSLVFVINKTAS